MLLRSAILYTMITEFNEMLIQLANFHGLPNLYHIDCRGVARDEHDWFDELHLKSESFGVIANAYKACMEENAAGARVQGNSGKVYLARHYR